MKDPLFVKAADGRIAFLPEGVKSDDVVPGVDCVLHSGNSSVGLHALCRKLLVVDAPSPLVEPWIERECGGRQFTPSASRVTITLPDLATLATELNDIIEDPTDSTFEFMKPREQGQCAKQIAEALIAAV